MASVAICPHCYLQLIVPDGIERDEPVECPTCAKEFDLSQAVLRAIPEVVRRKPEDLPAAHAAISTSAQEANDMVAAAAKSAAEQEANFVEEVKTRIEAELAAGGLQPRYRGNVVARSCRIWNRMHKLRMPLSRRRTISLSGFATTKSRRTPLSRMTCRMSFRWNPSWNWSQSLNSTQRPTTKR